MAREVTATRWHEERFAYVIKSHLLYGEKTRVIVELPEGDCFEAEIGDTEYMGEDWINLILRYVRKEGEIEKTVILDWFPDDNTLMESIRVLRSLKEQCEEKAV